jgi:hypothetical protein
MIQQKPLNKHIELTKKLFSAPVVKEEEEKYS